MNLKPRQVQTVMGYFLFDPEQVEDVVLTTATIIGYMWSGKTTLALRIAELIRDYYGEDMVNIVLAQSIQRLVDAMDDKFVQFLILDDPLEYHFARGYDKERVASVAMLANIRHIREEQGCKRGIIILLVLTQYYWALDPFFRDTPLLIFKTVLNNPRERYWIRKLLGDKYYRFLSQITYRIYFSKRYEDKRFAVAKPIGKRPFLIEYSKPSLSLSEVKTIYRARPTPEPFIDELDNEIIRKRIMGLSVRAIAKELDMPKSTVYNRIQKLRQLGLTL